MSFIPDPSTIPHLHRAPIHPKSTLTNHFFTDILDDLHQTVSLFIPQHQNTIKQSTTSTTSTSNDDDIDVLNAHYRNVHRLLEDINRHTTFNTQLHYTIEQFNHHYQFHNPHHFTANSKNIFDSLHWLQHRLSWLDDLYNFVNVLVYFNVPRRMRERRANGDDDNDDNDLIDDSDGDDDSDNDEDARNNNNNNPQPVANDNNNQQDDVFLRFYQDRMNANNGNGNQQRATTKEMKERYRARKLEKKFPKVFQLSHMDISALYFLFYILIAQLYVFTNAVTQYGFASPIQVNVQSNRFNAHTDPRKSHSSTSIVQNIANNPHIIGLTLFDQFIMKTSSLSSPHVLTRLQAKAEKYFKSICSIDRSNDKDDEETDVNSEETDTDEETLQTKKSSKDTEKSQHFDTFFIVISTLIQKINRLSHVFDVYKLFSDYYYFDIEYLQTASPAQLKAHEFLFFIKPLTLPTPTPNSHDENANDLIKSQDTEYNILYFDSKKRKVQCLVSDNMIMGMNANFVTIKHDENNNDENNNNNNNNNNNIEVNRDLNLIDNAPPRNTYHINTSKRILLHHNELLIRYYQYDHFTLIFYYAILSITNSYQQFYNIQKANNTPITPHITSNLNILSLFYYTLSTFIQNTDMMFNLNSSMTFIPQYPLNKSTVDFVDDGNNTFTFGPKHSVQVLSPIEYRKHTTNRLAIAHLASILHLEPQNQTCNTSQFNGKKMCKNAINTNNLFMLIWNETSILCMNSPYKHNVVPTGTITTSLTTLTHFVRVHSGPFLLHNSALTASLNFCSAMLSTMFDCTMHMTFANRNVTNSPTQSPLKRDIAVLQTTLDTIYGVGYSNSDVDTKISENNQDAADPIFFSDNDSNQSDIALFCRENEAHTSPIVKLLYAALCYMHAASITYNTHNPYLQQQFLSHILSSSVNQSRLKSLQRDITAYESHAFFTNTISLVILIDLLTSYNHHIRYNASIFKAKHLPQSYHNNMIDNMVLSLFQITPCSIEKLKNPSKTLSTTPLTMVEYILITTSVLINNTPNYSAYQIPLSFLVKPTQPITPALATDFNQKITDYIDKTVLIDDVPSYFTHYFSKFINVSMIIPNYENATPSTMFNQLGNTLKPSTSFAWIQGGMWNSMINTLVISPLRSFINAHEATLCGEQSTKIHNIIKTMGNVFYTVLNIVENQLHYSYSIIPSVNTKIDEYCKKERKKKTSGVRFKTNRFITDDIKVPYPFLFQDMYITANINPATKSMYHHYSSFYHIFVSWPLRAAQNVIIFHNQFLQTTASRKDEKSTVFSPLNTFFTSNLQYYLSYITNQMTYINNKYKYIDNTPSNTTIMSQEHNSSRNLQQHPFDYHFDSYNTITTYSPLERHEQHFLQYKKYNITTDPSYLMYTTQAYTTALNDHILSYTTTNSVNPPQPMRRTDHLFGNHSNNDLLTSFAKKLPDPVKNVYYFKDFIDVPYNSLEIYNSNNNPLENQTIVKQCCSPNRKLIENVSISPNESMFANTYYCNYHLLQPESTDQDGENNVSSVPQAINRGEMIYKTFAPAAIQAFSLESATFIPHNLNIVSNTTHCDSIVAIYSSLFEQLFIDFNAFSASLTTPTKSVKLPATCYLFIQVLHQYQCVTQHLLKIIPNLTLLREHINPTPALPPFSSPTISSAPADNLNFSITNTTLAKLQKIIVGILQILRYFVDNIDIIDLSPVLLSTDSQVTLASYKQYIRTTYFDILNNTMLHFSQLSINTSHFNHLFFFMDDIECIPTTLGDSASQDDAFLTLYLAHQKDPYHYTILHPASPNYNYENSDAHITSHILNSTISIEDFNEITICQSHDPVYFKKYSKNNESPPPCREISGFMVQMCIDYYIDFLLAGGEDNILFDSSLLIGDESEKLTDDELIYDNVNKNLRVNEFIESCFDSTEILYNRPLHQILTHNCKLSDDSDASNCTSGEPLSEMSETSSISSTPAPSPSQITTEPTSTITETPKPGEVTIERALTPAERARQRKNEILAAKRKSQQPLESIAEKPQETTTTTIEPLIHPKISQFTSNFKEEQVLQVPVPTETPPKEASVQPVLTPAERARQRKNEILAAKRKSQQPTLVPQSTPITAEPEVIIQQPSEHLSVPALGPATASTPSLTPAQIAQQRKAMLTKTKVEANSTDKTPSTAVEDEHATLIDNGAPEKNIADENSPNEKGATTPSTVETVLTPIQRALQRKQQLLDAAKTRKVEQHEKDVVSRVANSNQEIEKYVENEASQPDAKFDGKPKKVNKSAEQITSTIAVNQHIWDIYRPLIVINVIIHIMVPMKHQYLSAYAKQIHKVGKHLILRKVPPFVYHFDHIFVLATHTTVDSDVNFSLKQGFSHLMNIFKK